MGINGLLTDVRWEWTGTEVTADLITGTTVLPVLDPEAITEGENVWIAETGPYEIVDVDVDAATFTVTPGLLLDIDSGTEVATDIGGQPGRAWVCEVILADADVPIEVPLTVHDLAVMPEGYYDPPVVIVLSDDLERVENLPGSLPTIDGVYIPPESLPEGPQGIPGPPGADGSPQYTWVKYADSPTSGMTDDPLGKAYMGLSYNHADPTESSNYGDYQWSKVQGDPGPPAGVIDLSSTTQVLTQPAAGGATTPATAVVTGVATNTTITTWEYSSDGAGFTGTVPTGVSRSGNVVTITGATMVAKTITVRMTNGAGISDSLTVSRVSEGAGGAPGPQGPPGVGISSTAVTYQVGSSGTSAPTGAWLTTPPATTPGTFLWTRTITTMTDASTTTSYSVAAHGTTGLPGDPGPPGDDGAPGPPGRGIASTAVTYQVGSDGTSAPTGAWVSSPPATTPGTFLWTRTVTTYTDATTSTAYSVAAHGATGGPGSPGSPGAPGVGVSGTTVTYQVGNSGTSAPTGTWVSSPPATTPGTFLWTRTVTTYTDASTSTAYSVAAHGATGGTGSPGSPGVGVASTAVTYQTGSSGTSAPTGTWVSSPPATSPGQFLWTRTITTYTDSTTSTGYSVAAHGTTGNPGADAYTIVLSNEAHTFPGSTNAALAGSTTTLVTALKGAAGINASIDNAAITGAPTGMTTAVSGSPGTPTVTITVTTALVALNGTLTIPVVVDGFTFNKIFSWSVSRQGTQGTPGTPGADGTPRYTWTKYADNATGTVGFSDVPLSTTKYLGMAYNQLTLTESNIPGDYQWVLIQGPQGTPGSATDGLAPTASVTNLAVIGGIGALFVRWTPINNHDPVTYDLHVSTVSGFTPDASTLVISTMASSHTIRTLPTAVGDPLSTDLRYGTTYYVRVIARDPDPGVGPTSPQASGQMMQVNNADIAVNSVTADQIVTGTLTGDLFAGEVVLGSTISTGALDADGNIVGARIDLGPNGLVVYDSTGTPITSFPLDQNGQAFIRQAHLEILSADVIDNFIMHGRNNRLDASAKFTLGKGIEAPSATPTLTQTYDHVQFDTTTVIAGTGSWPLGSFAFNPAEARSMAWDPTNNCWNVIQEKSAGFRQWRFNADGTIKNNLVNGQPWIDDFKGFHKASTSGQGLLFTNNLDWIMWGASATIPAGWIINANQDPYLAWDAVAGQHMLVQNTSGSGSRPIQVRRFTTPGGVPTSQSVYTSANGLGSGSRINGTYYGSADFGAARYVTSREGTQRILVYAGSTRYNTNGSYQEWDLETAPQAFGIDGAGAFCSLAASGSLTKYTNWTWTADPVATYVGMSGFDSRTAGDQANPWPGQTAGQHETPVGTFASMTMKRRSKLTITVPVTQDSGGNDDQNQWKVYWARVPGSPVKTDLHLVATLGSNTVPQSTTMLADSVGGNPPGGIAGQSGSGNNFPAGNPAQIASAATDVSSNPLIDLRGDGSGRLGPFKWDKNGVDLVKNGTWMAFTSAHGANLVNATFTTLGSWATDSSQGSPTGSFISGVGAGLFTFTVPGVYQIIATGTITAGGAANPLRRIIAIFRGATEVIRNDISAGAGGNYPWTGQISCVMRMAAGDTFSIQLWQNSGSAIPAGANPGHECHIIKLSD